MYVWWIVNVKNFASDDLLQIKVLWWMKDIVDEVVVWEGLQRMTQTSVVLCNKYLYKQ